jgi:hypothetical protein
MVFRAGKKKYIPTWFWILFFVVPLFIVARWFFWWFFTPSEKRTSALEIEVPRGGPKTIPRIQDKYEILKGIGPKTSDALHKAGLQTFEQLGLMNPEKFVQLLQKQGLPTTNAAFWQEQARLAAVEEWEKLEKLQGK